MVASKRAQLGRSFSFVGATGVPFLARGGAHPIVNSRGGSRGAIEGREKEGKNGTGNRIPVTA